MKSSASPTSRTISQFLVVDSNRKTKLAECVFATEHELKELEKWPRQVSGNKDPKVMDALEFASLSSKRWRFYHEHNRTGSSIRALKHKITSAKNTELAVLCVAKAKWASPPIMGIALFRRTWCNNLLLEFLATHPFYFQQGPQKLKGIGPGLLHGISEVAHALGSKILWAEATALSASFYKNIFELKKVDDLLYVPQPKLNAFRVRKRNELKLA